MAAAATAVAGAKDAVLKGSPELKALIDTFRLYSRPSKVDHQVRKAIEKGKLGLVLSCVQQSKQSTLTLKSPGVIKHTIRGLRADPQRENWSTAAVNKALRRSRVLAALIESEEQGFGKRLQKDNDPRRQPEVLGTFLELAAVNAHRHNNGQDSDGKVKVFAARLMSCIEARPNFLQERSWTIPEHGQVDPVLDSVPIWHGLSLAIKILGEDMPQRQLAEGIVAALDNNLTDITSQLKKKNPAKGTYGDEALRAYEKCIR